MAYSFNQALFVYPLDAASNRAMVLCEVPAQKDSTLRFALPADLLDLLRMFDGRKQTAEVVEAYGKLNPGKYSLEKVENLVQSFLLPKSLLIDVDAPAFLPEISSKRAGKVRLIPPQVIYPVAKMFGWAFKKWILISWLALFVLAHLVFYIWIFPSYPVHLSDFTGPKFSNVMLLSLLAAFIHETGHASALVSYGCKQTEIGFGLYIYYPVLYTDVSEAWKLTRQRRAMIDMAGVYFQSVFQLLLLGLFLMNGSTTLLYFFLFNDLIMARTMNPFLRMDGYWLVADLFGIFNLREQSTKLIKHYVLKLFGSGRTESVFPSTLNRKARVTLFVYTVLCTAFFFYLCAIMIRLAVVYMIPTYPARLYAVWQVAQAHPLNLIRLFSLIFEVLWRTAVLCGLSLFAFRLVQGLWSLSKFLIQMLLQRLGKALKLREQGIEPSSSSRS
jgi:putative peptide zinc metalloprotease protein